METKKSYTYPRIELIVLDNQISLALESEPPPGPGEYGSLMPEHFNNYPFSENLNS